MLGDLDLAEEALQDAFVTAIERWPRDGVPVRPGAWIVTTARNRAVAVAMADGPDAGLVLVEALGTEGALADYHLYHAARADLLRRVGRRQEAAVAYERALALTANEAERGFLARRLAEVRAAG